MYVVCCLLWIGQYIGQNTYAIASYNIRVLVIFSCFFSHENLMFSAPITVLQSV